MSAALIEKTSEITPWALGAKNIKRELSAKWPWVKWRVKSDAYSMGDSIDVFWELGPTVQEVEKITNKYRTSSFDGMQDLKTCFDTPHTLKYGGADHVSLSRSKPEGLYEQIGRDLCALQHVEYAGTNTRNLCGEHDRYWLGDHCHQLLCRTSFGRGEEYAGVEHSTAGLSDHWCRIVKRKAGSAVASAVEPSATVNGAEMVKTKHTQKGYDLFAVRLGGRVPKDQFHSFLAEAKALGGWWSSYDKDGAIPGFQFKTETGALAFLHVLDGKPTLEQAQAADSAEVRAKAQAETAQHTADKIRQLATKMDSEIERKLNPPIGEQNPTARRIRIAEGMRHDGQRLQLTQAALRAIADQIQAGTVPPEVQSVRWSKRLVHEALHWKRCEENTLVPKWLARIVTPPERDEKAERIRHLQNSLVGSDIPGFFPTPPDLVDRMVAYVQPEAGETILEPSAGSGAIACAVNHGAKVEACEVNYTLRELLGLKGVNVVGTDFMEYTPEREYDGVLMNPPFERGQDIEHIRKAFGHLKQGGRMAAICAASVAFRQDAKYEEFRQWLGEIAADMEDIPSGAFERSGTGVSAKLLLITK